MRRQTVESARNARGEKAAGWRILLCFHRGPAAELSEAFDGLGDTRDGKVDVGLGGEPAQAEAQAAASLVVGVTERTQDMARSGVGRCAGGATADGQAAHFEQQGFAIDVARLQTDRCRGS